MTIFTVMFSSFTLFTKMEKYYAVSVLNPLYLTEPDAVCNSDPVKLTGRDWR
jgi:hypothetical protein